MLWVDAFYLALCEINMAACVRTSIVLFQGYRSGKSTMEKYKDLVLSGTELLLEFLESLDKTKSDSQKTPLN